MKVYLMKGNQFMGFYQELGSTVEIVGTRKVVKTVEVKHTEMVEEKMPDEYYTYEMFYPEHKALRETIVEGHYETRTRLVPAHYEDRTVTEPAHWGTREYWLEPTIEIRYRFVGTAEQRAGRAGWELVDGEYVFVGTAEQRAGRAGWESYEVEIPGVWQERRIWFPDVTRTYKVLVPEHEEEYQEWVPTHYETLEYTIPAGSRIEEGVRVGETKMVERTWVTYEDVAVDDPIFGYIFYPEQEKYELIATEQSYLRIAGPQVDFITIRDLQTGRTYDWEGEFLGYATRIGENQYVVP